ncbi:YunC family protein [Aestuariicella hydrocarbonica]|uniref:YunC family protein n=2 Tax=Pseudomaricurvus hydrocarbonicus TaxID=1470433 RepID=A0A9E5MPF9_9GAMM|nr:YunC family protein [Aestuariicella hydrocarbonica]
MANPTRTELPDMDWNNLTRERVELKLPLLVIKGSKGLLACAYLDIETCNKTGEACAIVSGVKSHDDMLKAQVKAVSDNAKALGIEVGMNGIDAVNKLR